MKYSVRPGEIDAWQFMGFESDGMEAMPDWVAAAAQDRQGSTSLWVKNHMGITECKPGDFVMRYPYGNVAVMDPVSFHENYEAV